MLLATAPLGDLTGSCQGVEHHAQDPMDTCLPARTERGLQVQVAMTDGAPLSTDRLPRYGAESAPHRCLLHGIKEVQKRRLDGVRASTNRRKRQGNTGRQTRRGRPSNKAHKQSPYRQGLRKQEPATCLWDHPSRIVRQPDALSAQEKADRALLVQSAPALQLVRPCHQPWYRLLASGLSTPGARARRRRLVPQAS
jgi:hypothetical protein